MNLPCLHLCIAHDILPKSDEPPSYGKGFESHSPRQTLESTYRASVCVIYSKEIRSGHLQDGFYSQESNEQFRIITSHTQLSSPCAHDRFEMIFYLF
jgi:hypothetical protein